MSTARNQAGSIVERDLSQAFPPDWLRGQARETGLIKRERKIDAVVLFWVFVFKFGANLQGRLASLKRAYEKQRGTTLSDGSWYKRFTPELVAFLHVCLMRGFEVLAQECHRNLAGSLGFVKDVLIQDSTIVRVHKALAEKWPAARARKVAGGLCAEQTQRVRQGAQDFPAVWKDPEVPPQHRKRMVRLLVEDVTLLRTDAIDIHVRFRGGAIKELRIPTPPSASQKRPGTLSLIERLRELSKTKNAKDIVAQLNAEGVTTPDGRPLTRARLHGIRFRYHIPAPRQTLRERGYFTVGELAERLNVHPSTLQRWARLGLVKTHRQDDRGIAYYEDPGAVGPVQWKRKSVNAKVGKVVVDVSEVVQSAA